jgi:hypothetical protein
MAEKSDYCTNTKDMGICKPNECAKCEFRCPDLMPENRETWELWVTANTQWRMGRNGPVGLDYPAIMSVCQVLFITMTPALLKKIRRLEEYELKRLHEKAKNNVQ